MNKVSVVGLGYIGLPTAVLAAQRNYTVLGFDVDTRKVNSINQGETPFEEPELQNRLNAVLACNRFKADTKLHSSDCFVIAVPTPFKDFKKADLSYLVDATKKIAEKLQPGNLVIIESTIPVGTTQKVAQLLEERTKLKAKKDFYVAHCPERVLPGRIFKELVTNERIIGGICKASAQKAKDFYTHFISGSCTMTDDKTAEIVKLVENSSRDVEIAFANQVASICEEADVNPFDVITYANKHPRVNLLQPGCGVGGHCLAVDPWFLIDSFPKSTHLLKAARLINDTKPQHVVTQIVNLTSTFKKERRHRPKILVLGLTFKANVDDLRESPALSIAKNLNRMKDDLDLFICEPRVEEFEINRMRFENTVTLEEGLRFADMVVFLVAHDEFKTIELTKLENKIIVDPCGMYHKIKQTEKQNAPVTRLGGARLGNSAQL